MPDELVPSGDPEGSADKEDDEARQFILQVKKTIERCLEQRMNKVEMFRVIREEGLPTWIAFAVYKELREQNTGLFMEYYAMHDQKEQREKLGRLIRAYRTGRSNALAARARAPETGTTMATAMETDTTASRLMGNSIGAGAGGGDQFAGAALAQQAVPFPGGQQLHDDTVYQEWLRAMPWVEEAAPTRQVLHIDEQSLLPNGMFQGVTWPHLPPGQPRYPEQAAQLLAGQQQLLHYQEQDLPAGQQPHCQQQAVHLPAEQQQLMYLQQEQLMYLQQEQLMANGGFQVQGAALTLAAGLRRNSVMDSWPLPQDGFGWGREQQDEPLLQRGLVQAPIHHPHLHYPEPTTSTVAIMLVSTSVLSDVVSFLR